MSSQTSQLLDSFEALPEEEEQAFTVELLRRAVPYDSGPLDDAEETTLAADQLFAMLAAEENDTRSR